MTVAQSYNDVLGHLSNPSAFREAYWRGARIWKDAAKTIPRDCQRFFLAPGVAENWSTLRNNLIRLPEGTRVGFRITDMDHVPDGWPSIRLNNHEYPDWREESVWTAYDEALDDFKAETEFGQPGGVTWVDIPYIWRPSNEPSITDADCATIGGGNVAEGKKIYLALQKRMIDLYVEKFGRALVGNLGGPTWAADVLLPYAKARGVRAFRHDSWMYFDWRGNGKPEGDNRARLYLQRINIHLSGRDEFDRLIVEQTGNGLTLRNGVIVDQGSGAKCTVYATMMLPGGEFEELEATDYGNMGLPAPAKITSHPNAQNRYEAWYTYIGQPSQPDPDPPPGDGADPDPVPAPYQFPVTVRGGEIVRASFGGPYPDIEYDEGTTETVIPIPIANGERWNPRVQLRTTTGSVAWTIDPSEPSDNDLSHSFHTQGRDSAVVTFDGWDEPIPDPDPTDPVEPPEYVPWDEFKKLKAAMDEAHVRIKADLAALTGVVAELQKLVSQLEAHNDSWADAMEEGT